MSTIKVNNLTNVAGDTVVSMSGGSLSTSDIKISTINSGPVAGTRNKIINGAMEIDQRNAGGLMSLNNVSVYTVDRWTVSALGGSGTGTATSQQVVDSPSGFKTSLKYTVTNAKTPASGDTFAVYQRIEGQNITDFAFGTASAKTITLSFWVKSSLTGTFSGVLRGYNGTTYRSYVFTYTINAANTWEYETITVIGDTGQVTATDNTVGFDVIFDLGSGSTYQTSTLNSWQTGNFLRSASSVNLISTLNATFQVTGVQLEIGTQATPFERRSYGQELALCQRYYSLGTNLSFRALSYVNDTTGFSIRFPTEMRTSPTVNLTNVTNYNSYGANARLITTGYFNFSQVASTQNNTETVFSYNATAEL